MKSRLCMSNFLYVLLGKIFNIFHAQDFFFNTLKMRLRLKNKSKQLPPVAQQSVNETET